MLYSKVAGVVSWSEGRTNLRKGQSVAGDHPLAEERPDLFTDEEPGPSIQNPARVESGVQRPGENRAERGGPRVVKAPPRG